MRGDHARLRRLEVDLRSYQPDSHQINTALKTCMAQLTAIQGRKGAVSRVCAAPVDTIQPRHAAERAITYRACSTPSARLEAVRLVRDRGCRLRRRRVLSTSTEHAAQLGAGVCGRSGEAFPGQGQMKPEQAGGWSSSGWRAAARATSGTTP